NLMGAIGALLTILLTGRGGFLVYIGVALVAALIYSTLPKEGPAPRELTRPLERSRHAVLTLAALFSLDAAGGGFVVTSLLVLWLHLKFDLSAGATRAPFFAARRPGGLAQL